jgi:hypothetical protein
MAEEQENGGGTSLKSILIGLVSTITIAVGGFITNKLTGEGGNEPAPVQQAAPINITNSNQQQQSAGKTVIIKEKAAPASANGNQAKPVEKAKPKEKEDEEW